MKFKRDHIYSSEDVLSYLCALSSHENTSPCGVREQFAEVINHPRWRLVKLPANRFHTRRCDEDVATDYEEGIEHAPPVVAELRGAKYFLIDGAHRHAAAAARGKQLWALVPAE